MNRCRSKTKPGPIEFRCLRGTGHLGRHHTQVYPGPSGKLVWGRKTVKV